MSLMVPLAVAPVIAALPVLEVALLSWTGNVSWFSTTVSFRVVTVASLLDSPAPKLRSTLLAAVKSPSAALADPVSRVEY